MAWFNLLNLIYPVGSVYFSVTATSPSSIIGGTWTQLTGGVLGLADSIGIADAGSDGGSRLITQEQLPTHAHNLTSNGQGHSMYWGTSSFNVHVTNGSVAAGSGSVSQNLLGTIQGAWSTTATAGGGTIIRLPIPLCTLGSGRLKGGER